MDRRSISADLSYISAGALALVLCSASAANALPPADGSKCSSNWVNNAAAMNCFIQGEDEQHAGAKHPHYVACTAAGEVFCCQDNDQGGQNCEVAEASTGHPVNSAVWVRAVLAAQASHLKALRKTSRPVETRAPMENR
jgi:hypothetical protein